MRMGRSRIGWAVGIIAPWCLGLGAVVSFTAAAGQDASIGASLAQPAFRSVAPPLELVPSIARLREAYGLDRPSGRIQLASLTLGDKAELLANPDEIEPRRDLKSGARDFPSIDRTRRGDPIIGLRPTLDTRLRKRGGIETYRAHELALSAHGTLAFDGFSPADGPVPGPESVARFEPPVEAATQTGATESPGPDTSSGAASSATTTRPVLRSGLGARANFYDGATPATPRAVALSSSTPARTDTPVNATELLAHAPPAVGGRKIETAALPPQSTIAPRLERPDYAALVDHDHQAREQHCLAQAIYFEARSEPADGQAAVAQVILNRVSSGLYPASICGVVFQNRHRYKACQFSFACEGRSLRITEPAPWAQAKRIAADVLEGRTYVKDVGAATHYHADYVRPGWSRRLKRTDKIGQHIFYKLRPGQT